MKNKLNKALIAAGARNTVISNYESNLSNDKLSEKSACDARLIQEPSQSPKLLSAAMIIVFSGKVMRLSHASLHTFSSSMVCMHMQSSVVFLIHVAASKNGYNTHECAILTCV